MNDSRFRHDSLDDCLAVSRGVESRFRKRGRPMAEARTAEGKIRQGQKESIRPLIPAARIQKRIRAMAKEIRRDFPEERLHLVSVLKGGVFFLTDLARSIPGEVSFDFIPVASYGQNTHSSRSEERRVGKECRSRWSP